MGIGQGCVQFNVTCSQPGSTGAGETENDVTVTMTATDSDDPPMGGGTQEFSFTFSPG